MRRPDTAALHSRVVRLVQARTREKNQVHAVLTRNLLRRPPMSDLFGRGAGVADGGPARLPHTSG